MHRIAALLMLVVAHLVPVTAEAHTCWTPSLSAASTSSSVLTLSWTPYTGTACTPDMGGVAWNRYRIEVSDSAISTWNPGGGTLLAELMVSGAGSYVHVVGRATRAKYYAIFPCSAAGAANCASSGHLASNKTNATTQYEKWVAKGLTSGTDSDRVAESDASWHAPDVLRIPAGWMYENQLLMYYSTASGAEDEIHAVVFESDTWTNWNTAALESGTPYNDVVAQNSPSGPWQTVGSRGSSLPRSMTPF
jgi:hypothetical protein